MSCALRVWHVFPEMLIFHVSVLCTSVTERHLTLETGLAPSCMLASVYDTSKGAKNGETDNKLGGLCAATSDDVLQHGK